MTFELSSIHQDARERARTFATDRIQPKAGDIDRAAAVPAELATLASALVREAGNALGKTIVVEELAIASGAVALKAFAAASDSTPEDSPGLRGAPVPTDSTTTQLCLSAVALGIGQAAINHSLAELRQTPAPGGSGTEKPHWIVADAATDLEAARLLTRSAAQVVDSNQGGQASVAIARLMSSSAARTAVDAAVRIAGSDGYREGSLLERLSRDVRAISLLLGTEEDHRSRAADELLPGR
jgi:alkylation response protein AidB-like acyl-CoA dehydrogenase